MKKIEPEISVESVFLELESDRENKTLNKNITSSPIKYQISETHEGCLEQINENGDVSIGFFENGRFRPINKL